MHSSPGHVSPDAAGDSMPPTRQSLYPGVPSSFHCVLLVAYWNLIFVESVDTSEYALPVIVAPDLAVAVISAPFLMTLVVAGTVSSAYDFELPPSS